MEEKQFLNEPYLIPVFAVIVIVLLIIDLGVFNRKSHKVTNKEAVIWSSVWISVALLFGGLIYFFMDSASFSDYLTAYLIEKALSVDNLFVFVLIFTFFKVPEQYQHKVLFYGILGAIITRAIFIFSGVWIIHLTYLPPFQFMGHELHLNLILMFFGLFLLYAGIKSAFPKHDSEQEDFSKNIAVRITKKIFPVVDRYHNDRFFIYQNRRRYATMLFLTVAVIEMTDVLFAVDSIPAIFAVTNDPFILYSSNIFAILGLRTLYFLLANFINLFRFLKYGLAFILSFIGLKMLLADFVHIPSAVSLSIVALALILSTFASVVYSRLIEPNKNVA
jgi:tellurite resistance protein TerC